MDRKGITVLLVSFIVLMLWFPLVNKLFPPVPRPQGTNIVEVITNLTADSAASPGIVAPEASTTPSLPPPATPLPVTGTDVAEKELVLEIEDALFTFTSHGGGIKKVALKDHQESVSCQDKEIAPHNFVTLNAKAPLPILALLGDSALQGDGVFELSQSGQTVRAEKVLTNGLHVIKEFTALSNHLMDVTVRIENTSDTNLALAPSQWIAGTATPLDLRDDGLYMGAFWYDGDNAQHIDQGYFANRFLGCFPGTPREIYQAGSDNVRWAAVHNQFFTIIVVPEDPAAQVIAVQTNLPPPSAEQVTADPKAVRNPTGYLLSLTYPGTNLLAGATLERSFQVYTGPKEYNTLARLGARMQNNLDLIMDYSGFFGFFAKALLLSMNGLHSLGLSYALAIIAITIIIKTLFWPLTSASTKSMKRMAALQPQMKALQERFKDDPVKMNKKLMEFMKEHKVSPLGGCLPMLLQIPVFFGFYRMILSATELRGARFLWACDLSRPDTLFIIPGFGIPFNPLPLIMGATMLWQARLTPPSPGMDPMQQKIMKYMPLMFLVILYNFSAGLTLYWTVQNLLTIAQMKLTRTKDETGTAPASPARPVAPAPQRPKKKK